MSLKNRWQHAAMIFIMLLASGAAYTHAAAGQPPSARTLKLGIIAQDGGGIPAQDIEALLTATLSNSPLFALVERQAIHKVLEEQKLQSLTDSAGAIKIGQLVGADLLLFVEPLKAGKSPAVRLRTVETANGIILMDELDEIASLTAKARTAAPADRGRRTQSRPPRRPTQTRRHRRCLQRGARHLARRTRLRDGRAPARRSGHLTRRHRARTRATSAPHLRTRPLRHGRPTPRLHAAHRGENQAIAGPAIQRQTRRRPHHHAGEPRQGADTDPPHPPPPTIARRTPPVGRHRRSRPSRPRCLPKPPATSKPRPTHFNSRASMLLTHGYVKEALPLAETAYALDPQIPYARLLMQMLPLHLSQLARPRPAPYLCSIAACGRSPSTSSRPKNASWKSTWTSPPD